MRFRISIFLLTALILPSLVSGQSTRKRTKEGNELFQGEKYDQALNKYQDALLSDPENRRLQFNVGSTLYKKKKYEEALEGFQKVVGTDELEVEQNAYYNMGNTLYRMGKLPESILAYQQALKLNPDDMDAKYNLEYVRRKLKDNSEKQQSQQQDQQQQQQQQQQQNQDDQQNQESQDQEQSEQEEQDQQQRQQQQQENQQQLSKEDAERILDALKNDEKDIQKKRKVEAKGRYRVDKDW